ncbi:MAG: envelope stress response membrane protein PspC, partial [Alphaproteobacteria bacterium]
MSLRRAPSRNRLYRNPRKAKIKGVCAGIADYFGISALPIRVLAIAGLFFATAPTIIGYVIAVWLIDETPEDLFETEEEEAFWRSVRTEPSGTAHDLRHKFRDLEKRLRGMEAHVTSSEFELNR